MSRGRTTGERPRDVSSGGGPAAASPADQVRPREPRAVERTPRDYDVTRGEAARGRTEFVGRGQSYALRGSQHDTLRDIGSFRTVAVDDLVEVRYAGDRARATQDLRELRELGLTQPVTASLSDGQTLRVVVLTPDGKDVLDRQRPAAEDGARVQQFHAGFVKPAELAHDTAIYRMYHLEAAQIERAGGTIQRVVLDHELKQAVYTPLAKARGSLSAEDYDDLRGTVAEANHLAVVDGAVPLPDLQIEYLDAQGEVGRVNLELTTEHYRGAHMVAKAAAGFKLYAAGGSGGRYSANHDRGIVTKILS